MVWNSFESKGYKMVFNAFTKMLSSFEDTKKVPRNELEDSVFISAVHSVVFTLVCSLKGKGGRIKSIF